MKVWDWAGIKLSIPGSAVRLAYVARHITDCATRTGVIRMNLMLELCYNSHDLQFEILYYLFQITVIIDPLSIAHG